MGFSKDFIWGAATASYQIEGGYLEDGRGLSVWDIYSHNSGNVYRDHNGDIASDHYHKLNEDIDLLTELSLKNYRFSVSWTRLLPNGIGEVNYKGIDFYNRLIDKLLERNITPWLTIFHWDYPQALQIKGGWENPDSVKWFTEYAQLIGEKYGDRVKKFFTINEPQCFIGLGYKKGEHAPGYTYPDSAVVPMAHHVLKAHGETVRMLRDLVKKCEIGYATCANPTIPKSNSINDIEAARTAYFTVPNNEDWTMSVAWWNDPVFLGKYPEDGMKYLSQYLPKGWEDDLKTIAQPIDYVCQNIYQGNIIENDEKFGWKKLNPYRGSPKTACQWDVTPEALYWGPKFLYERYKLPIIITENGMSAHDVISLDGKVHDPNRIDYIHRYLLEYEKAAKDGVDLAGYFAWSLLDNFEWSAGYSERFGLIFVDYENDCHRIVKDSALWYKTMIETNGENL